MNLADVVAALCELIIEVGWAALALAIVAAGVRLLWWCGVIIWRGLARYPEW